MVNMSAKVDEAQKGLVSIVFTRSNCDAHTDEQTASPHLYYIPNVTRCEGILIKMWKPSTYK